MSAAAIVQAWIAERDAALEADAKGLERPPSTSIAGGSWNGSATTTADLTREAQVLRFLQRALAEEAEVEAAKAAPGPTPFLYQDAQAVVAEVFSSPAWGAAEVDTEAADVVLEALGWPR